MENQREDLVVIFAGYADRMDRFFQSNPGFRSRIAHHIDFPDYSVESHRFERSGGRSSRTSSQGVAGAPAVTAGGHPTESARTRAERSKTYAHAKPPRADHADY
jgi:hypothetical protein